MTLRPYLLGAVALALAGAVVWDYWPEAPSSPVPAVARPAAVLPLNPMSQRPQADFAALFDHPLFDPTRTKAAPLALPVADPAPAQAASPAPVAQGPAHPVLMGTVTSPWPGGVYLGDDQGGPVVFLRPGDAAQGLHLEEARPDSALFMGPEGEITLTLQPAAPAEPAPTGNAPDISAADANADSNADPAADANTDPNAPDMGAMAPGAIDPTLTDPKAAEPALTDPEPTDTAAPTAPVPQAAPPTMPAP